MKTILINCTILTSPEAPVLHDSYILVTGERITEIGSMDDLDTAGNNHAEVVDCAGCLVMPGLINGHNHAAMTLFRGLADDLELSSWLNDHIFPAERLHANREMVYWCTRLAAAEMLLSGTTCVADAYFFSPESARALADCGMRGIVGHGIVDFPAPSVPDPRKNIAVVADFIDEWKYAHPLITPAVFAHAPYTCSPTTLTRAKELADREGVRFFTHIAESRAEQSMIIDPQDTSPVGHLEALNLLDQNTVLIHAVWLNEQDLSLLAASGASVITCPQSNLKLASGIAPVPDMLQKQIPVGIGTDGCASNNGLDLFREMDLLAKLHKGNSLEATLVPAASVLACATSVNASILGVPDCGELAIGNLADLVVIDLNQPHLTPFYNSDLLVYAASGSDVRTVMINGKLVVRDRAILSFDLEETMTKVREFAAQLNC